MEAFRIRVDLAGSCFAHPESATASSPATAA
jgi:hypothetical protein